MLGAVLMMLDVSGCRCGKLVCQSHRIGHSESDIKVHSTLPCVEQCAHLACRRTVHGAHMLTTYLHFKLLYSMLYIVYYVSDYFKLLYSMLYIVYYVSDYIKYLFIMFYSMYCYITYNNVTYYGI